jgi:hypothetical protein
MQRLSEFKNLIRTNGATPADDRIVPKDCFEG